MRDSLEEFPEPNPVYWFTGDGDNFCHHPRTQGDSLIFTEGRAPPLAYWLMMGVPLGIVVYVILDSPPAVWKAPASACWGLIIALVTLVWLYRVGWLLLRRKRLVIETAGVLTLSENWPRRYRIEAPLAAAKLHIVMTTTLTGRGSWDGWALCLIIDDQWFVLGASRKGPEPLLEYAHDHLPMFKGQMKAPFYSVQVRYPI